MSIYWLTHHYVTRNVPGSAMYFFALAEIRSALSKTHTTGKNPLQSWDNLLAGAAARGSVGFVMMPVTVVKIRYEVGWIQYIRTAIYHH
jgi:solute carrier family 25 protein 38